MRAALLGTTLLGTLLATTAGGGCEGSIGFEPTHPSGGSGTTTSPTTTSPDGGGSGLSCVEPADGRCDEPSDCDCALCKPSALCQPEGNGCLRDYQCDPAEDACTCSDCDLAAHCFEGHTSSCDQDGTCDFATEGCGCPDCGAELTCWDNDLLCEGAAPDGTCDPEVEDCACTDCLGWLECVCVDDGACTGDDMCTCVDCWTDEYCSDPEDCEDDGICEWYWEGCHCADCAGLSFCAGFPG